MVIGSIKPAGSYPRVVVRSGIVGKGGGIFAPSGSGGSGSSSSGTTKTQTPTYDPTTQTYTDKYGNKQSMAPQNVPLGTEVVSSFQGTKTSSGGYSYVDTATGKSYEVSPTGIKKEIINQQQTQAPLTLQEQSKQPQPLAINVQEDFTIKERLKNLYYNVRYGDTGGKVDRFINRQGNLNPYEEQQRKTLEVGFTEENKPFTKSGRGTITATATSQTDFKPATEEQIIDLASEGKISEKVAVAELGRREAKKYGQDYNFYLEGQANTLRKESENLLQEKINESQNNIQDYKTKLQNEVNSGSLKVEEANDMLDKFINSEKERLNDYTENLNKKQQQKLQTKAEEYTKGIGKSLQKSSEKYLKLKSDEIKFNKLPETFFKSFVIGAAITAGAIGLTAITGGVAAPVIAGVGYAGLAVGGASASYQLGKSYGSGTLTGKEVANVVVPFAGFYLGSKAVSGVYNIVKTNNVAKTQNELRGAIERSEIESKVLKGITTERAIAKLQIPETQKVKLQKQLKAGGSIKVVEAKIRATNELDRATINKNIPFRDIKFLVVTDSSGNVIDSVSIGRVVVGKGKYIYREDIISGASGTIGDSGEVRLQRLTLGGQEGQYVTRAVKTAEVIKPTTRQKGKIKIVTGESVTAKFEEAYNPEGITYEDLVKVARSQYGKAVSKSKFGEILKLGKTEQLLIQQQNGLTQDIIVAGKNTYATQAGASVTERIIEPIVIKPKTTMKPFLEEAPKPEKFIPKQPSPPTNQKQIQKIIKNIEAPISLDTTAIKSSLSSTPEVVVPYPEPIDLGANKFSGLNLGGRIGIDLTGGYNIGVAEGRIPSGILEPDLKQVDKNIEKLGRDLDTIKITKLKEKEKNKYKDIIKDRDEINDKIKDAMKDATKSTQPTRQPQLQLSKLQQNLKLKQQIIQIQNISPIIPLPIIKIPKTTIPNQLKTQKKVMIKPLYKFPKIKKAKVKPAYTASLGAAAFQEKPIKISRKEYERLSKVSYSGLETRPVFQIEDETDKLKKEIKKVQF